MIATEPFIKDHKLIYLTIPPLAAFVYTIFYYFESKPYECKEHTWMYNMCAKCGKFKSFKA